MRVPDSVSPRVLLKALIERENKTAPEGVIFGRVSHRQGLSVPNEEVCECHQCRIRRHELMAQLRDQIIRSECPERDSRKAGQKYALGDCVPRVEAQAKLEGVKFCFWGYIVKRHWDDFKRLIPPMPPPSMIGDRDLVEIEMPPAQWEAQEAEWRELFKKIDGNEVKGVVPNPADGGASALLVEPSPQDAANIAQDKAKLDREEADRDAQRPRPDIQKMQPIPLPSSLDLPSQFFDATEYFKRYFGFGGDGSGDGPIRAK